MKEIKLKSSGTFSLTSDVLPTKNLTPGEIKKLAERDANIDLVINEAKKSEVFVKFTKGINKGTIVKAQTDRDAVRGWWFNPEDYRPSRGYKFRDYGKKYDPKKEYEYCDRRLTYYFWSDRSLEMMKMNGGILFPGFMNSDVTDSISLLIDYDGPEVFCLDETKRPATFEDRLGQDVAAGDLVVVARLYGAGLDVCKVMGYSDHERVVLESCENGALERIPLVENQTDKIMKMPMTLKDTALMMKLSGSR
jgi:hypothetical protein